MNVPRRTAASTPAGEADGDGHGHACQGEFEGGGDALKDKGQGGRALSVRVAQVAAGHAQEELAVLDVQGLVEPQRGAELGMLLQGTSAGSRTAMGSPVVRWSMNTIVTTPRTVSAAYRTRFTKYEHPVIPQYGFADAVLLLDADVERHDAGVRPRRPVQLAVDR